MAFYSIHNTLFTFIHIYMFKNTCSHLCILKKEGSGWGTHVYLWRIHFDIWQN